MQRLYERIEYLEQQLSALVSDYQQQRATAQELHQENVKLKHKLAAQVTRNTSVAEVIKGVHYNQLGGDSQGDLRRLIDSCLQYIDQCISFLES
ncbi:MAG: hypothetical protein AAFV97_02765 [Bacteroidota bacterium]